MLKLPAHWKRQRAATGDWRVDERGGPRHQVFLVVAPDGLCYYFHQPIAD